jgi:2-(1,2-epoxy-1,2-dihydrophenyl)acetyl-CoA isomerase
MDKPVIAAINGYCMATGLDLALVSDFRIAAEDARIGEMRVKMGMTPSIGAYFLTRVVGMGRAKSIALIGETISAAEALSMGLVHKVVPSNRLMVESEELANNLADGPMAIGITKKLINYAVQADLESCMRYFYGLEYQVIQSEDHKEAVKAFIEKRNPIFIGR